ncbi:alpha/beta fold hydrolase [Devosia naphthalenivorans]|uniref:alpha/beta fold hydrolase n=1 Tax=Devosia naphthalenivorans TaxID=2082392 RepID=UPI0013B0616C|nr:alpha/beta hydrolase [Devosia naphthalenivorans]
MAFAYGGAIARARSLVAPELSTVVPTRFGDLEYAEAGKGVPLLMVHGTGGGFDQALFFARRFKESGYRVIAPSRFGYLRSAMPPDPSSENQADAFVDLLDALQVDSVAVAGGSAGALSAMAFAIRHPDRCAALLPLVPASYVPRETPVESVPPVQMQMAMAVLRSDFLFWLAIATLPDFLTRALLATSPALVRAASHDEQARARHILESILPVSRRVEGLLNDARLSGNPAKMSIETIAVPTLAVSYEDDAFGTAAAARYIGEHVRDGRVHIFPDGGHIGIGHDAESFFLIDRFLGEIGYV